MKKSIFRWGFVLCMLVGLMTIGASAASIAPPKTVCNGHPTEGDVVWTVVNEPADFGSSSDGYLDIVNDGFYVLNANIDLGSDCLRFKEGSAVTICLNGKKISGSNSNGVIMHSGSGGTLKVCDCQGTGKVEATADTNNRVFSVATAGTGILEGGTFCAKEGSTLTYGVRTTVENAIIKINGATISGANTAYRMGKASSSIEFYSGTVDATKFAYNGNGTETIYGGTFTCLSETDVASYLTKDVPLLVDAVGTGCSVAPGFYRDGSRQDFSTKLQFRLYLKCDNDIFSNIANGTSAESLGWSVERSKGAGTMNSSGSQFVLFVGALTAKDIGTPVTCTVKDADGTVLFEETISAADVAKEIYDGTANEAVKTLMEDLVNYGNAAAEAFGGTPVNALGKGTTVLTQDWTRSADSYGATGEHDLYATLSLKNTIELNIYHEDAEGNVTYQTLSDIAIADALTSRDVTFDDDCTVTYSIKDYILDVLNDGVDNGQDALISALQKYIDSLCKVVKG